MKNILAKLHSIQAEVEQMEKDGHNSFQNYNYLSETQVTLKMKGLLDKHKVMFLPKRVTEKAVTEISPTSKGTKQYVTTVTVDYAFADIETGEMYEGSIEGQGSDTADKGIYKAITGAIKYIYMKTFNIPTGDDPEKSNGTKNGNPKAPVQTAPQTVAPATRLCNLHGEEMTRKKSMKTGKVYFSHIMPDGKHCFGGANT